MRILIHVIGRKWRYSLRFHLKDAYYINPNFEQVKNQGYFAIYDGHGGIKASQWLSENLHTV
jgi:serine/threonine protein phosphatase PrpC